MASDGSSCDKRLPRTWRTLKSVMITKNELTSLFLYLWIALSITAAGYDEWRVDLREVSRIKRLLKKSGIRRLRARGLQ